MKTAVTKIIINTLLVLMLCFIALVVLSAPWPFVDYIFAFVFNGIFGSVILFVVLLFAVIILSVLMKLGGVSSIGLWARRQWHTAISGLDILFILYCLAGFTVALCLDLRLSACVLVFASISIVASEKMTIVNKGVVANIIVSYVSPTLLFAVVLLLITGILVSLTTLVLFVTLLIAIRIYPLLNFKFGEKTLWRNIARNKFAYVFYGGAIIIMYFTWFPNINDGRGDLKISANSAIGGGAGIEFMSDGRHIVYLNKSNTSVDLVDRKTLKRVKSLAMPGYPRQLAYDRAPGRFYIAIHSVTEKQLQIISESPFEVIDALDIPPERCTQLNAVAVDTRRNLIYAGCDDTGDLFVIDRTSLEVPAAPVPPGPAGKGVVRIDIDNDHARMFVSGCLMGPFITELQPCCGLPIRYRFTGYLVWETIRDPDTRRLFQSVPLRSIVAVIDEKTLKVENVVRSGLGARALAVDPVKRRLFVGCQISGRVDVLDLDTLKLLDTFYLPFPRYFLYSTHEKALYVAGTTGLFRVEI